MNVARQCARVISPLLMGLLVMIASSAVGAEEPEDLGALNQRIVELYQTGNFAEAMELAGQSLVLAERQFGPDHPNVAESLTYLAALNNAQGRYGEAEPLCKRALAILENALGPDHSDVAKALNNLAELYRAQARYADAEPLYQRSLRIQETALGTGHPDVADPINNLALLYFSQGRFKEAEPLIQRSLEITEKAVGADHPSVATVLNNQAELFEAESRYADAEPLFRRSLAIREKALDPGHPHVGLSLHSLASLYLTQARFADAEPLFRRGLANWEKALGPEHPDVGNSLVGLAATYYGQGRYGDAEPLLKRALAIAEKALGPDHPEVGNVYNHLAVLYLAQRDWPRAAESWRRGTRVITRRTERGTGAEPPTGQRKSEAQRASYEFVGLVKVLHRLTADGSDPGAARETFETAQWARSSEAAASLAQMAARAAGGMRQGGNGDLAGIVRERQDLVVNWQRRDGARTAAISQAPDKRDRQAEAANLTQLTTIDARIAAIDLRLKVEFPDYAALASPEPLTVAQVQADLRLDEALVLFLDTPELKPTPEETFIWVVTKTDMRWVRSEMGTPALTREVGALRCGLDYAGSWRANDSRCNELLETTYSPADHRNGIPLPFDSARAFELYKTLFGEIEDLIRNKHLLIVPSGPMTQLPFQVLVTRPPTTTDYSSAAWLARSNAITVLPAVSSLKALRQNAKASVANEPFIGFGNPVLDGNPICGEITIPRTCPDEDVPVAAAASQVMRSVPPADEVPSYFRGGLADVAAVRKLCPLPDTAHELACVAKSLGAPASSVILGRDMTETSLKKMPLNSYRVIHFATHGLLAGEAAKLSAAHAEPALVMSPPDVPTEEDDGLLTSSEIAGLKLDADWVVMSACNTAGSGEQGTEALSGLARAFFYAGARALLVSHWPVSSYAATMLTSRTFARMRKDAIIGRSEAFRRAMLSLMSDPDRPWASHPSYWAPFVVVGEGGAAVR